MAGRTGLALLAAGTGCTDLGGPAACDPAIAAPSFRLDVQPLLASPTCVSASCHSAATRAGGISLQGVGVDGLVGVRGASGRPLVVPFDAGASYLVRKLEGRDILGNRMPLGGAALSAGRIDAIRRWIDRGAPDD